MDTRTRGEKVFDFALDAFVWVVVFCMAFVATCYLSGCRSATDMAITPPPIKHPFINTATELAAISDLMGWVATLSILCVGVGIVLMVYIKTDLGPAIAAGGFVTLILSLVIKSTIWFVPWIALAVVIAGVTIFIVDAVKKKSVTAAVHDFEAAVHSSPTPVNPLMTATAPYVMTGVGIGSPIANGLPMSLMNVGIANANHP